MVQSAIVVLSLTQGGQVVATSFSVNMTKIGYKYVYVINQDEKQMGKRGCKFGWFESYEGRW